MLIAQKKKEKKKTKNEHYTNLDTWVEKPLTCGFWLFGQECGSGVGSEDKTTDVGSAKPKRTTAWSGYRNHS